MIPIAFLRSFCVKNSSRVLKSATWYIVGHPQISVLSKSIQVLIYSCRCIILAAIFMLYLDRVEMPFPTGCRKRKDKKRVMKLPVLQMFPVRL